jgi:NAD(P)-dependent dehydrogenase (short-subunit alcohol dehydrogenase family)
LPVFCYDKQMDLHLKNHVTVVTGGANGIGLASVRAFAEEGADVQIWDLHPDTERIGQNENSRYEVEISTARVDVVSAESVFQAVENLMEKSGQIDHLVHCAAVGSGKFGSPFTKLSPNDWKRVLDINIMGMVEVAHAVAPVMKAGKQGTMVFISSVAGQIGSPTDPPYSASKAANINFAQCMAQDLAGEGIRVNTVCPGMVQTNLNRDVWKSWNESRPEEERLSYEEWGRQKCDRMIPLARWQKPEDIADMVVFLSSKRAAQVTGQTINVDGGFVMHC